MAWTTVGTRFIVKNEATAGIRSIDRQFQSLTRSAKGLAGAFGVGLGVGAIAGGLRSITAAAVEHDRAVRGMRAAYELTGVATKDNIAAAELFAKRMQGVTTHSDEAILSQMAYAANMGISADEMEQATKAAIGLAARYSKDLPTAMRLVALARKGETGQLKEMGIVIDKNMSALEKYNELVRQGAEGFSLAAAEAKTLSGRAEQLGNTWQDVKEKLGAPIAEFGVASLELFADGLTAAKKALDDLDKSVNRSSLGQGLLGLSPEQRRSISKAWPSAAEQMAGQTYSVYPYGRITIPGESKADQTRDYTERLLRSYERSAEVQEQVRKDIARQVGRPTGEVTGFGPQPFDPSGLWSGDTPINFEGQYKKIASWKDKNKDAAIDIAAAMSRMYDQIDARSKKSFEARRDLIVEQVEKFEREGIKPGVAGEWKQAMLWQLDLEEDKRHGGFFGGAGAGIREMNRELKTTGELGAEVAQTGIQGIVSGTADAVFEARNLADAFEEVGRSIARMAFEWAMNRAIVGGLNALLPAPTASRMGNVFGPSGLQAFGRGGVVSGPTLFGYRGGTALGGEAGPEAIMPLARNSRGELSVKGSAPAVTINVTNSGTAKNLRVTGQQYDAATNQMVISAVLDDLDHGGALSRRLQ